VTAVQGATPVQLPERRGGPDVMTLRKDRWWIQPLVTFSILFAFVVYVTWAAFQNRYYFVSTAGHPLLISPLYSPCLVHSCTTGAAIHGTQPFSWWNLSPALLVLIVPGGFRVTCYYYRRSYYRAFWWSPPSCAVQDHHTKYSGETRLPLVLQNAHRYFFYLAFLVNIVLTFDAIEAFLTPSGSVVVSIGTVVLVVNAALLWLYTLSCHACRHLCGGHVKSFSKHPVRKWLWDKATPLNARHMQFAWASLVFVAFTDVYVRLVATGAIHDLKLF
jgi:hypothetical protein